MLRVTNVIQSNLTTHRKGTRKFWSHHCVHHCALLQMYNTCAENHLDSGDVDTFVFPLAVHSKRAIIMPLYTRTGTSIEDSCDGSVVIMAERAMQSNIWYLHWDVLSVNCQHAFQKCHKDSDYITGDSPKQQKSSHLQCASTMMLSKYKLVGIMSTLSKASSVEDNGIKLTTPNVTKLRGSCIT